RAAPSRGAPTPGPNRCSSPGRTPVPARRAARRQRSNARPGNLTMDPREVFLERAKAGGGGIVPVIREVVTDADTPVAAFAKIARPPFAFLLESLVGGERWARYTFLGTEPREAWRYRGQQVDRWTPAAG